MSAFLLFLLAASVRAQTPVVEVPAIPAMTLVSPALAGSLSNPASPVSVNLNLHAAGLAQLGAQGRLDPGAAAANLAPLRHGQPLDRVSAGVLGRALAEPGGTAKLLDLTRAGEDSPLRRLHELKGREGALESSPELAALAQAARSESDTTQLFEGRGGGLDLEPLTLRRGALRDQGAKVKKLGQGAFGVVYPHPRMEGAVLKLTEVSFEAMFAGMAGPKMIYESDIAATRHLATHDLGPRFLGEGVIERRPVAVKERVYGPTVMRLIWDRKYGPDQHAVVMDLLDRMADRRVRMGDMNPANFMIGRTLVDPTIRAYHIDGGEVGVVEPGESRDQLRTSLYHQTALFKQRMMKDVGLIESTIALSSMLEEGLRREAEKTFWQRLKGLLRATYITGGLNANSSPR